MNTFDESTGKNTAASNFTTTFNIVRRKILKFSYIFSFIFILKFVLQILFDTTDTSFYLIK